MIDAGRISQQLGSVPAAIFCFNGGEKWPYLELSRQHGRRRLTYRFYVKNRPEPEIASVVPGDATASSRGQCSFLGTRIMLGVNGTP